MTRIPLMPTTYNDPAYDFKGHVVELEKVSANAKSYDPVLSKYDIYVDDVLVGNVTSKRETPHTTYKGTRIRRDLRPRTRWRGHVAPSVSNSSRDYIRSDYAKDSRYEAIKGVVHTYIRVLKQNEEG